MTQFAFNENARESQRQTLDYSSAYDFTKFLFKKKEMKERREKKKNKQ